MAKIADRILNCIPSRNTETDWQPEHAIAAGVLAAAPPIPASKDLREDWWLVGDQARTGSCVGWATVDSVLRWHFVNADRLSRDMHLSPRFIWMAAKETDEFTTQPTTFIEAVGTSLKAALDIARKYGVVPDSLLPFASGGLYPGKLAEFFAIAAQRKISSYFNLGRNPQHWKAWIANNGPVLTRLDVDDTWAGVTHAKPNLDVYHAGATYGGHAVALVGYTQKTFVVRNSWGEDWGDKGFAYASMKYADEAFTEAYGVAL